MCDVCVSKGSRTRGQAALAHKNPTTPKLHEAAQSPRGGNKRPRGPHHRPPLTNEMPSHCHQAARGFVKPNSLSLSPRVTRRAVVWGTSVTAAEALAVGGPEEGRAACPAPAASACLGALSRSNVRRL